MITVQACILYVVVGFGGVATGGCYMDGTNMMMISAPHAVFHVTHVNNLPRGRSYYSVEAPLVDYWTLTRADRSRWGSYFHYVRYRPTVVRSRKIRRHNRRYVRKPVKVKKRIYRKHRPKIKRTKRRHKRYRPIHRASKNRMVARTRVSKPRKRIARNSTKRVRRDHRRSR